MQKIALIPARRGSKRFQNKNIAKIGNETLVDLTIQQALISNIFDEVILSSDDPAVLGIGKKYNIKLDDRDKLLSDDITPLITVIQYIIKEYGLPRDASLFLLQVTNPLRKIKDILGVDLLFHEKVNKGNTVVTVCKNEYPIELLWKINDVGNLERLKNVTSTRKQDFHSTYKWNDACVVDSVENFNIPKRLLFGECPTPYIMPPERSIYIDYEWQFKLIEKLLEN